MYAQILHSGFDFLKFTIQTDILPALRAELEQTRREAADRIAEARTARAHLARLAAEDAMRQAAPVRMRSRHWSIQASAAAASANRPWPTRVLTFPSSPA